MSKLLYCNVKSILSKGLIFALAKLQIFFSTHVVNFETKCARCNRPIEDFSLSVKSVDNFYLPVKKLPLSKIRKKLEKYVYVTYGIVPVNSVY